MTFYGPLLTLNGVVLLTFILFVCMITCLIIYICFIKKHMIKESGQDQVECENSLNGAPLLQRQISNDLPSYEYVNTRFFSSLSTTNARTNEYDRNLHEATVNESMTRIYPNIYSCLNTQIGLPTYDQVIKFKKW